MESLERRSMLSGSPSPATQPTETESGPNGNIDCGGYANCPKPTGSGHYEYTDFTTQNPLPDPPKPVVRDVYPDGFANDFSGSVDATRYVVKYEWTEYGSLLGNWSERICLERTLAYSKSHEIGVGAEGGIDEGGITLGVSISSSVSEGKENSCDYHSSAGAACDTAYQLTLYILKATLHKEEGTYTNNGNTFTPKEIGGQLDSGYIACQHKFLKQSKSRHWVEDPVAPPPKPPTRPTGIPSHEEEDVDAFFSRAIFTTPGKGVTSSGSVWSTLHVDFTDDYDAGRQLDDVPTAGTGGAVLSAR